MESNRCKHDLLDGTCVFCLGTSYSIGCFPTLPNRRNQNCWNVPILIKKVFTALFESMEPDVLPKATPLVASLPPVTRTRRLRVPVTERQTKQGDWVGNFAALIDPLAGAYTRKNSHYSSNVWDNDERVSHTYFEWRAFKNQAWTANQTEDELLDAIDKGKDVQEVSDDQQSTFCVDKKQGVDQEGLPEHLKDYEPYHREPYCKELFIKFKKLHKYDLDDIDMTILHAHDKVMGLGLPFNKIAQKVHMKVSTVARKHRQAAIKAHMHKFNRPTYTFDYLYQVDPKTGNKTLLKKRARRNNYVREYYDRPEKGLQAESFMIHEDFFVEMVKIGREFFDQNKVKFLSAPVRGRRPTEEMLKISKRLLSKNQSRK